MNSLLGPLPKFQSRWSLELFSSSSFNQPCIADPHPAVLIRTMRLHLKKIYIPDFCSCLLSIPKHLLFIIYKPCYWSSGFHGASPNVMEIQVGKDYGDGNGQGCVLLKCAPSSHATDLFLPFRFSCTSSKINLIMPQSFYLFLQKAISTHSQNFPVEQPTPQQLTQP